MKKVRLNIIYEAEIPDDMTPEDLNEAVIGEVRRESFRAFAPGYEGEDDQKRVTFTQTKIHLKEVKPRKQI